MLPGSLTNLAFTRVTSAMVAKINEDKVIGVIYMKPTMFLKYKIAIRPTLHIYLSSSVRLLSLYTTFI